MRQNKKKTTRFHAGGNYPTQPPQAGAYGWCIYSRLTGELFGNDGPTVWLFKTRPEASRWRQGMFLATDYVVRRVKITPFLGHPDAVLRTAKRGGRRSSGPVTKRSR